MAAAVDRSTRELLARPWVWRWMCTQLKVLPQHYMPACRPLCPHPAPRPRCLVWPHLTRTVRECWPLCPRPARLGPPHTASHCRVARSPCRSRRVCQSTVLTLLWSMRVRVQQEAMFVPVATAHGWEQLFHHLWGIRQTVAGKGTAACTHPPHPCPPYPCPVAPHSCPPAAPPIWMPHAVVYHGAMARPGVDYIGWPPTPRTLAEAASGARGEETFNTLVTIRFRPK